MEKVTTNKQLEQVALVLFKEDSERIPTELLPLMVVFGLIALCSAILRRLSKDNYNGKFNK